MTGAASAPARGPRYARPMHRWLVLLALAACGGGHAAEVRPGGPGATSGPGAAATPSGPPGAILAAGWDGGAAATATATGLPPLRSFGFTASASAVLPGDSREPVAAGCDGYVSDADRAGRVSVRAAFYQNGCYTDGAYNARDFEVETGTVTTSDGASYKAFRIHPARSPATQFLASHHHVYYRFDAAAEHTLYTLDGAGVRVVAAIATTAADDARLPIDASALTAPAVYFVVARAQRVSALDVIGDGVEGARLAQTPLGDVDVYHHAVDGAPFDTRGGFAEGPASWASTYSDARHYFPVELADGTLGIVWQDTATAQVQVTTLDPTYTQRRTTVIDNPRRDRLAAATSDGGRRVFLCLIEDGNGAADDTARAARIVRADLGTGERAEGALDTSRAGLDVVTFEDGIGAMAYAGGKLGLTFGRFMHRSSDGLNHQGGIAAVIDAETLTMDHNLGQTSGHSFENVLVAADDAFHLIDLGDNYPRGVHLHRCRGADRASRVVFTFKTQHGTTAVSPAGATYPEYREASTADQTLYQWSNDNLTYTELGGLAVDADGYTVVFAGEASGGRALDNRRTGGTHNDPRNLGLVRVRRDLRAADAIVSSGVTETGGFYDFGGGWNAQQNTGVVWLTAYADLTQANASRVRAVGLADGNVLILWEQWTPTTYVTTYGMKVDPLGNLVTPPVELGAGVRLGRRDDVLVRGADVVIVGGRAADRALELVVLRGP